MEQLISENNSLRQTGREELERALSESAKARDEQQRLTQQLQALRDQCGAADPRLREEMERRVLAEKEAIATRERLRGLNGQLSALKLSLDELSASNIERVDGL